MRIGLSILIIAMPLSSALATLLSTVQPNWGFKNYPTFKKNSVAQTKSLIFDQPFDNKKIRPFVEAENSLEKKLSKKIKPRVKSKKKKSKAKGPTKPQALVIEKKPFHDELLELYKKWSQHHRRYARNIDDLPGDSKVHAIAKKEPSYSQSFPRIAQLNNSMLDALKAEESTDWDGIKVLSSTEFHPKTVAAIDAIQLEIPDGNDSVSMVAAPETEEEVQQEELATTNSVMAESPQASPSAAAKAATRDASPTASTLVEVQDKKKALNLQSIPLSSVFVFYRDELDFSKLHPVENARIHWISESSRLQTQSNSDGFSKMPYSQAVSMRYIVHAEGYLPAIGYASLGTKSAVELLPHYYLPTAVKSLGLKVQPGKHFLFGRVLDQDLNPQSEIRIDLSQGRDSSVHYAISRLPLFHAKSKHTGLGGTFIASNLDPGIQYLMPTSDKDKIEWPAKVLDISGIPRAASTTIVESQLRTITSQAVDAFMVDAPRGKTSLTVGGQRGVELANAEGFIDFDLYKQDTVNLVELRSQGYRNTWLSTISVQSTFPELLSLFTDSYLVEMFPELHESFLNKGILFANLNPSSFRNPVEAKVFSSKGRLNRDAQIFYFDQENRINPMLPFSTPDVQNIAVTHLDGGEWHLIINNAQGQGLSCQVFRVEENTVAQLQF